MNTTERNDYIVPRLFFVVCSIGLLLRVTQLQAQDVLPFPEPPSASTAGKTLADSKHQWRTTESHLPKVHYHVVQADTNFVLFYVRAIGKSRDDWPQLAELMRQWKQYPLSQAGNPLDTKFVDITGKKHDTLIPKGPEYFELLARYINLNPPREQDMAMLGALETLGIAHGRLYGPGETFFDRSWLPGDVQRVN